MQALTFSTTTPGEIGLRVDGPSGTAGKSEGMRDETAPGDARRRSASARGVITTASFRTPPSATPASAGAEVAPGFPSLPATCCSHDLEWGGRTLGDWAQDGRRECPFEAAPFACI